MDLYVQFGCGWSAPQEWLNFDASPTLVYEKIPVLGRLFTRNQDRFPANVKYGDIVAGLPVPEATCQGVYCSHVLEHLALRDARTALGNVFKLLKPGGVFRMVLPDLEYALECYRADASADAAMNFLRQTGLGRETRPRSLAAFIQAWLGNSQHLWMWDYKSLQAELEACGFTGVGGGGGGGGGGG
ncbi:MAG: methyltransferase domain-containing protein, partial [Anaerolineaceae bacterium]|nr:methyltransferase domain-containing protein [Anaerolineaceae bacterium]